MYSTPQLIYHGLVCLKASDIIIWQDLELMLSFEYSQSFVF